MKEISKPVMHKGTMVATCVCQQAETMEEAILLAGSAENVVELFNREFMTISMNKLRPQKSIATGAKKVGSILKKLSPEVQAALNAMDEEAIAKILSKIAG